jgi:hypothetical protein
MRLFAAIAAASVIAVPALADREMNGNEAHQTLAGQKFAFHCADGTRGEARYAHSGVAMASYRQSSVGEDVKEIQDQGRVRAAGANLCIRWNNLNGGQESCFRVTERKPGQYRISLEDKIGWCDITLRNTARAERN